MDNLVSRNASLDIGGGPVADFLPASAWQHTRTGPGGAHDRLADNAVCRSVT